MHIYVHMYIQHTQTKKPLSARTFENEPTTGTQKPLYTEALCVCVCVCVCVYVCVCVSVCLLWAHSQRPSLQRGIFRH